jgi:hypothetical protein
VDGGCCADGWEHSHGSSCRASIELRPTMTSITDSWITLEEARERSDGKVEWRKFEGLNGEVVQAKQHHPDGPEDRPVRLYKGGRMYLGGWKKLPLENTYKRHGFGVFCFANGRVGVGHRELGNFSGPGKLLWLPSSRVWENNNDSNSAIKTRPNNKETGLPLIYLGNYKDGYMDDKRATVLLKDGTTRIGPWKRGRPVGDWWEDHEKSTTGPEKLAKLLSIGKQAQVSGEESASINAPTQENGEVEEVVAYNKKKRRQDQISSIQQDQVSSLTKWLTEEAIGYHADPDLMEKYAQEFVAEGLHSVQMIQDKCTPQDIESFQWMKRFHKRQLISHCKIKVKKEEHADIKVKKEEYADIKVKKEEE